MPQTTDCAIGLIVTPSAGTILLELSKTHYLWIREFEQNMRTATLLRHRTTFRAAQAATPEDLVLEYLETIDLHHPDRNQLVVIGAPLTEILWKAIQDYGSVDFHINDNGFTAESK